MMEESSPIESNSILSKEERFILTSEEFLTVHKMPVSEMKKIRTERSKNYHEAPKDLDVVERSLFIINNACNREIAKLKNKGRKVKFHVSIEYLDEEVEETTKHEADMKDGVTEKLEIEVNDKESLKIPQVAVEKEQKIFPQEPTPELIMIINNVLSEKLKTVDASQKSREAMVISLFMNGIESRKRDLVKRIYEQNNILRSTEYDFTDFFANNTTVRESRISQIK